MKRDAAQHLVAWSRHLFEEATFNMVLQILIAQHIYLWTEYFQRGLIVIQKGESHQKISTECEAQDGMKLFRCDNKTQVS